VTTLLHQLFEGADRDSGLIGTVETRIGSEVISSKRTTPEATDIQALAAVMRERHLRHLVIEASSHALQLHRLEGAHFAIAGFTNLTQDHLDFHGDMESYFLAKAKLFTGKLSDKAVVNIDDSYGKRLHSEIKTPVITVSRQNKEADWSYSSYKSKEDGYQVSITHQGVDVITCDYKLLGDYNLDNLLLAVAIAFETGLTTSQIEQVIPALQSISGRLEKLDLGQSFNAIIDYAHTPDAVDRVLKTAKLFTSGKVIAVLGCGGDRDQSKRPIMGNSLLNGSDVAVFTSDNPRGESAENILLQMVGNNEIKSPNLVITDRKEAIAYAVSVAEPGDTLLLLGKGHETGQEVNGEIYPFDDFFELENAIILKIKSQMKKR
jgi:UDP-N-acetylmuramoyl-L-alanyl-D-glutamate--2,6-diaminopimelate ligase